MTQRPWYKHYPSNFIAGTLMLTAEQKGVYVVLLDLMYDRGQPLTDDPHELARICGCGTRRFKIIRDQLAALGKIVFREGRISNPRFERQAGNENLEAEKLRISGRKGAEKTKKNRAEDNENKLLAEKRPVAQGAAYQILEERKKGSEANASAPTGAPELPLENLAPKAPKYTDSVHELWGEGPLILHSLGIPERKARDMIGLWLKQNGGGAQLILSAIQRARDHRVQGPIEWITRGLRTRNANHESSSQDRTTAPSRQSTNGADAILAGVGRYADRRFGSNRTTGPGDRQVSDGLDVAGQNDPHR